MNNKVIPIGAYLSIVESIKGGFKNVTTLCKVVDYQYLNRDKFVITGYFVSNNFDVEEAGKTIVINRITEVRKNKWEFKSDSNYLNYLYVKDLIRRL